MSGMAPRWLRWGVALLLMGGACAVAVGAEQAPAWVFLGLATTVRPLVRAWRGARGTALRAAVIWAAIAVGLGLGAQAWAWREPIESGRVAAGHWAYLSVLATLAALISVLNARTPGGGAWALLMGLLVLVFLIPWLEGSGLARDAVGIGRLRLGSPWTLFYALLVVAGVTNYLPTRYGPAAVWLALGFAIEYAALTWGGGPGRIRASAWSAVPWTLAVAIWTADWRSLRAGIPEERGLEGVWIWFRDHWGVVWALRIRERFNRTAETLRWPIRLAWHGMIPAPGFDPEGLVVIPDGAEATLVGLLRRFADPARIVEAAGRATPTRPCESPREEP